MFSIFKFPAQMKEEVGLNFRSRYPKSLVQQQFDMKPDKFNEMDKEWSDAMKYNKIQVSFFFFFSNNSVLSFKFKGYHFNWASWISTKIFILT